MQFTEEDRKIAAQICASKATIDLLTKVFTPDFEFIEGQVEKRALDQTNELYGQNMKALALAKQMYISRMATLKTIGTEKKGTASAIAPK